MTTKFTKMAYDKADDMLFGHAKKPVSYGLGIKVGAGRVIPEINYAPRAGTEKSIERITKEYVDYISKDAITRALTLGFPDLQLETEWVSQMGTVPGMAASVVSGQKAITEKYHKEYGINLAVRHTIPDQREAEHGLREGMDKKFGYPEKFIECCENACENGADVLSVESVGGKEFADYAVTHGDITAFLFGVGYLGSIDMEHIWTEMVSIAKKNKVIPGGDTNCSGANVSMFMAGGLLDNDVQRTFSAVTRAISAARTMVAIEAGATGPDKDCGYEGPIIKSITGTPTAQEGKNCQCAHADLQGNLMAQCCDLWSNESVEYHPEFGGSSVQCWLGSLGYETSLMNTAIATGQGKVLRDLYMTTDRTRGPEGYILAYDNAWQIGKAITENGDNYYLRAKAAGITAAKIIRAGYDKKELILTKKQLDVLDKIVVELEALPDDEDKFYDYCVKKYQHDVPTFNPKSYGF
ncbi:MAG: methyltransferase MtaB domain-containing protein [Methanomassiliicoccales archaeon]|uniref:methyltransferase MtaB domain-containing protein n=1 Tax=Candidatus Methanarcanum hacksteinii TaxID=2911857 RepID=UPI00375E7C5F|nr:methanol--corrinoid methyltransferase [Methanomassiliicoccales archaeon]MDD7478646.1 methyltransferase MtaB domain-containing protein [Methanomassiliicoccales archaeon]